MNGPFSSILEKINSQDVSVVVGVPDWLQAAWLTFAVTMVVLAALLFTVMIYLLAQRSPIVRYLFRPKPEEVIRSAIAFVFIFPLAGATLGVLSLVYGIEHASMGFTVGGGVVFSIALLVLLLISAFMPYFWISVIGMVASGVLGLYGLEYALMGFQVGGAIAFFIGFAGFMLTIYIRIGA